MGTGKKPTVSNMFADECELASFEAGARIIWKNFTLRGLERI
jgi:hypothetical protein